MAFTCIDMTGSDHVVEYMCSSCEEEGISQEAASFCKLCSKFYCCQCVLIHGKLFKKHETFGREELNKWPVSKVTHDVLENCREHRNENLKFYCENHCVMCCNSCVVFNHRQCACVVPINESHEEEITDDLQQLQERFDTILEKLNQLQSNQESTILVLLESYNESLQEIKKTRHTINSILNKLEKETVEKLDGILKILSTPLRNDVKNAKRLSSNLRDLGKAIQEMMTKGKELSFTAFKNCMVSKLACEKYIYDHSRIKKIKISFKTNTSIESYLSQRQDLGMILHSNQVKENQEICFVGESMYHVRKNNDKKTEIRGMCFHDGLVFMTDYNNKNVKILDNDYSVLSQINLDFHPFGICYFSPTGRIAVSGKGQIQCMYTLKGRDLITFNKLSFQFSHDCCGMAISNDDMYITSGSALYHYTRDGKPVKNLYEDSGVYNCAVNQSGDKIFVTNSWNKLLTLSRDGTILSIFTDRLLQRPTAVHVTENGQVLVCGENNIIQVDSEGKKKITALAIPNLDNPLSMCSLGKSVIVGSSNILVLKIE
ncbi:uncharacterized protein LOC127855612 [Dreissena polymorpha]|uniref:B box-type domain-containing protein n=1 Tax=Dreissena polymorpha TaxID=45954 RepID=A0A9D4C4N7_DREPO|nr:uncharacterized protein LOC127855612 [Dreissena polymorpha]KAH3717353.1 hypothetical protein DPMN_060139 [Dreissena polymorpha]